MHNTDETTEAIKHWLKKYTFYVEEYEALKERATSIREKAMTPQTSNLDDMPKSKGWGSKIEMYISIAEELEEEAKKMLTEAQKNYRQTEEVIKQIHKGRWAKKRAVLRLRYIDGYLWEDVNEILFGDKDDFIEREDSYRRRMFAIHNEALEELAEIIPPEEIQKMIDERKSADDLQRRNKKSANRD